MPFELKHVTNAALRAPQNTPTFCKKQKVLQILVQCCKLVSRNVLLTLGLSARCTTVSPRIFGPEPGCRRDGSPNSRFPLLPLSYEQLFARQKSFRSRRH